MERDPNRKPPKIKYRELFMIMEVSGLITIEEGNVIHLIENIANYILTTGKGFHIVVKPSLLEKFQLASNHVLKTTININLIGTSYNNKSRRNHFRI